MKKIFGLLIALLCISSMSNAAITGGLQKYAQVVQVAKTGGQFTSIQSAINSITDASATKPYCVQVNSGVYNESITMKPYVDLVGVDRDSCIITQATGTVITFSSYETIANLTVTSTLPTGTTNIIAGDSSAGTNIDNIKVVCSNLGGQTVTGISTYLSVGSTNMTIKDVIFDIANGANSRGIMATLAVNLLVNNCRYITGASGTLINTRNSSSATIQNCYSIGYGITFTQNAGNVTTISKNNYFVATTVSPGTNSVSSTLNSYNDYIGTLTLTAAATRVATCNAYASTIATVTKSGSGGTETFNSYGSIIGNTTFGNTYATTPELYALGASFAEGSTAYVTSAHKLYVRGASTWEAITSAP